MRSSKDHTIEKKRKNKAMKVSKTEKSRKRRIANGHKRDAIHAINPNLKITIIDGVTYTDDGINGSVAVEIMDGKIRATKLIPPPIVDEMTEKYGKTFNIQDPSGKINADFDSAVVEYQEVIDKEHQVVEEIKTKNRSALQRLTDRFKKG